MKKTDQAVETFQEIIRNQCDEITALKEKAEAYDRIMSGGKKTLKEWANIFGMPIAVDQDGEASSFAHVPVIHLDDGEGIWGNNPEHYGEETYLLPPQLIDFNGNWEDSLTLPDGWEDSMPEITLEDNIDNEENYDNLHREEMLEDEYDYYGEYYL